MGKTFVFRQLNCRNGSCVPESSQDLNVNPKYVRFASYGILLKYESNLQIVYNEEIMRRLSNDEANGGSKSLRHLKNWLSIVILNEVKNLVLDLELKSEIPLPINRDRNDNDCRFIRCLSLLFSFLFKSNRNFKNIFKKIFFSFRSPKFNFKVFFVLC